MNKVIEVIEVIIEVVKNLFISNESIREKLLQARELEKEYQKTQGFNQKDATKNFNDGLKELKINSIVDYHKLIKTDGHKGRTFKVLTKIDSEATLAIKEAIIKKEDTLILGKSTKDLIYIGDKNNLGNRINFEYCSKNNIPFVEFIIKTERDTPWLSVAGNYSAILIMKDPINMDTVIIKVREAMKNAFKKKYNILIEYDKTGDGLINNKKICGCSLQQKYDGVGLVSAGISLKENESLAAKIFPVELRHTSANIPSSAENILNETINTEDYMLCFVEELSKIMESKFDDNRNINS